mgnify:CR=1 FL=1
MATAIRTVVVLIFSWLMVLVTGAGSGIGEISARTMVFLVLSGLSTGASWLCYFHALQKGDINKVVPVDKSSTILTILLALIFLDEGLTWGKAAAVVLIAAGIMLMISPKRKHNRHRKKGSMEAGCFTQFYQQCLQALLQSLGKLESRILTPNLGTAIRTTVVLIMAWLMVFITGKQYQIRKTEKKRACFLLSCPVLQQGPPGFATIMLYSRDRQVWLLLWIN